jgi:hypothetical protein
MKMLLLFCLLTFSAVAGQQAVAMSGEVINTTGDIKATAQIKIIRDGEKIAADLTTAPPLTGTGRLTGHFLDGWCDLSGNLDGGLAIKFRGILNAHSFRGTYTVTPAQGQIQYGHFDFADGPSPAK